MSPSASASAASAAAESVSPPTAGTPSPAASPELLNPTLNIALIHGTLSADPLLRELPSGDIVADLSITTHIPVAGRSGGSGGRVSVPVAWRNPGKPVHRLRAQQPVLVVGHVARRFFRSGGRVVSRTEVVAANVYPLSQKAACRKAVIRVESAVAQLLTESLS